MKRLLTVLVMLTLVLTLSSCSNTASANLPQGLIDELVKTDAELLQDSIEQLQEVADYNRLKDYTIRHNFDSGHIDFEYTLQRDEYTLIKFTYCDIDCVTVEINETFKDNEFNNKVYELINKYQ